MVIKSLFCWDRVPDVRFPRNSGTRLAPDGLFDQIYIAASGPNLMRRVSRWKSMRDRPNGLVSKEKPPDVSVGGFDWILAVTYSRLAYGQTTIGAERFHFRVRNGIGWFPLAMAARQTV